jgi:ABC-type nitrate/sulfonate/bicarbonate transport system substrate-binding protein
MRKTTLAVLLMAALSGCEQSPSRNAGQRSASPLPKITVAYTVQPQCTLVHVAVAKGYFIEEGLDVQSSIHTFGKAALQMLLDGKADFASVAETPFMFNVLKGEKIFIIANIEASNMNNAIVAGKDAGISAPGDLKGKRIGFTPGTTSDFFLDSILTSIGLTRQAIQPVPLKPDEMQAAIVGRKVDAVCTWNFPLTQIKRHLGGGGILFYDREIYTETFNIAGQQDFVRKNPETVKQLLRALIKAENFIAQHTDSVTKTDPDIVREVWNAFAYRAVLDERIIITLEDETRWAIKNRFTDKTVMPDYFTYIYLDGLRAVKPEVVKIGG